MRKVFAAVLTGLFSFTLFTALPSNHQAAEALTFDPNACLDLSQVKQCEKGYIYKFVPLQGPYPKGTCRPYAKVKTSTKC
ncbi:hypothetical protein ABT160_15820 [Streptomyces sp. NPDC001941]|uniref:hypothetical protein n=1 Tax=Streptomyces sp. NPDC001941 TaxID=3154659 RepID=UPI00331810D3